MDGTFALGCEGIQRCHRHVKRLLRFLVALLAVQLPVTIVEAAPLCRDYRKSFDTRFVSDGKDSKSNRPNVTTCTFDIADIALRCVEGQSSKRVTYWPSLKAFLDEGRLPGLVLWSKTVQSGSSKENAVINHFDSGGRLVSSTISDLMRTGGSGSVTSKETSKETYSMWDRQGRPTTGIWDRGAGAPCSKVKLTMTYDDSDKVVTTSVSNEHDCGMRFVDKYGPGNWLASQTIYKVSASEKQALAAAAEGTPALVTLWTVAEVERFCEGDRLTGTDLLEFGEGLFGVRSPRWESVRDSVVRWCKTDAGSKVCSKEAQHNLLHPPTPDLNAGKCNGRLQAPAKGNAKAAILTTWGCNGGTTVNFAREKWVRFETWAWRIKSISFDKGGD